MFGYIRVFEGELKVKEYNHYRNAYCRLCRNIGFFSQIARLFLSYDMTFFSLLLDEQGYSDVACEDNRWTRCHKLSVNCKKANTDEVYRYTAAASVVLIYEKVIDDIKDGNRLAHFVRVLLSRGYRKAAELFPDTANKTRKAMEKYYALENEKSDAFSLAEEFGNVMSDLASTVDFVEDDAIKQIFEKVFNRVGAAVYLIDAIDDISKDKKSGNYNPILQLGEDRAVAQSKALEYLGEAERLIELLPYRSSIPIIRNIIHYGMPFQLNKALNKE